ncbi:MAG: methyltransferase domain-containing protein [Deltaproteobacteria bacterium]|nr:MAG: methyltransferase domain-containing protein [Deltaproteobacteria bacterium]
MTNLAATGPNADQIQYWNDVAGPKWVALEERLEAQIGGLGRRALERAGLGPGDRVLDVGCGCGAFTCEIARRVGPGGTVLGVDVSSVMLRRARQRASDGSGLPFNRSAPSAPVPGIRAAPPASGARS